MEQQPREPALSKRKCKRCAHPMVLLKTAPAFFPMQQIYQYTACKLAETVKTNNDSGRE